KNALVSGPKNAGYGTAKAAQLHLGRLMAAELAEDKIRVNNVNPDAVIADSKIWQSGWAQDRAKAYGVALEDLPGFYADRTLLKEIIYPADIAEAVFLFVGGMLNKSTGNSLNVDGGLPAAFPR
ncbi:MAG: SDR family oxidoreductase, partial [Bacteroidia bacterium]|nr:SDR family oxidoreductase [Bacteroidia bacterium]